MNISEFQKCANCGACYNVCPKEAIFVQEDGLFYLPTVDTDRCVQCSLCVKVCPVNQDFEGNSPLEAYAGWSKDDRVVLNSSSGGVFYELAQIVLAKEGVVFAAAYTEDHKAVCFTSSDETPLRYMMKSKYVESLVGFSFKHIKAELEANRSVLFCGTPCQVAGLQHFLGKEYDNLLTCDFACGGLPSHRIYREYLHALENKYYSAVQNVDFRPKTHGWKRYAIQVNFENGKEHLRMGTEDPYLGSFLGGKMTVRDYCMECKFPECHASDLSIADFWLHEKLSELRHEDGISLILCNTLKGKVAVDALHDRFILTELDVESASYNNRVQISEQKKSRREDFLRKYVEYGLESAYRTYLPSSFKLKVKNLLTRKLRRKRRKTR